MDGNIYTVLIHNHKTHHKLNESKTKKSKKHNYTINISTKCHTIREDFLAKECSFVIECLAFTLLHTYSFANCQA